MKIAKIIQDTDCESPRENDNLGTLCLFHRRYALPNESKMKIDELSRFLAHFDGVQLPVWAYDHGGVAFKAGERTYPFNDEWDSGQAGVIYIERKKIMAEYGGETGCVTQTDEQIADYLCGEVEVFSKWYNGECYGYVLKDEESSEIDSCCGFIGYDVAVEAAKEAGADEVVD